MQKNIWTASAAWKMRFLKINNKKAMAAHNVPPYFLLIIYLRRTYKQSL